MMDAAKVLLAATALWLFSGATVTTQQGRVHTMDRYPVEEARTGYAAETDQAYPGAYQLYLQTPQLLGGVWGWGAPANGDKPHQFRGGLPCESVRVLPTT